MGWISVDTDKPQPRTPVLGLASTDIHFECFYQDGRWWDAWGDKRLNIKYWQPLPPPPTEKGE